MRRMARLARGTAAGLCVLGTLGVLGRAGDAHASVVGRAGDVRAGAQRAGVRAGTRGVAVAPSRAAGALGPLINIPQTWNNCGPASIAEVLAYWGIWRSQDQVQAILRVDGLARGMTPFGVPAYARSVGLRALVGVGGSAALVKALVSNGFPVIVSQQVSVTNHIGHYRPIDSYDDRQGVFVASDPYLGAGHAIDYADFARIWMRSGNGFLVLYPLSRQPLLAAVLASVGWDRTRAYRKDLARLQSRLHAGLPRGSTSGAPSWGIAGYRYLGLAWDEVQLGLYAQARQDLRQAARQGANPVQVAWIAGEIGH